MISFSGKRATRSLATFFTLLLGLVSNGPASAAVPSCQVMHFYASALNAGLCNFISPVTQNLWVCGLAIGSPDIHTTFNMERAVHITVRIIDRAPGQTDRVACEGNADFSGSWPQNLTLQSDPICGVNVANYASRLNSVTPLGRGPVEAFIYLANHPGRITRGEAQGWIDKARQHCASTERLPENGPPLRNRPPLR